MKSFLLGAAIVVGVSVQVVPASADEFSMLMKCRNYAAAHLHVDANLIDVKYEGQRTDKTYAINGAVGPKQSPSFQCSFRPDGRRIKHFTVNTPEGCPVDVSEADRYKYPDCE